MKKLKVILAPLVLVLITSCNKEDAVCITYPMGGTSAVETTYPDWAYGRPDPKFKDFKNWCKYYAGDIEYK